MEPSVCVCVRLLILHWIWWNTWTTSHYLSSAERCVHHDLMHPLQWRLWYLVGFPHFFVSTLTVPPGTHTLYLRQTVWWSGRRSNIWTQSNISWSITMIYFHHREVFVCGLVALPVRAEVLTSCQEILSDFSALQLYKNSVSHAR